MSDVSLTLAVKDYDHIAPLASGDVEVDGINLDLDRDTPKALDRTLNDETIEAGELSFARHIIRLANGDRSFVGIPIFPTRNFRNRSFFVKQDSGITEFAQLEGKRIGTNEWPATGNTWGRALLRERGVNIDSINWWVGPIVDPPKTVRPQGELPEYVQPAESDRTLLSMLHDDELDALMCPISRFRGQYGFHNNESPVVRLKRDYRGSEKEYYERTGLYPIAHLIGIRREVYDRHPWIAQSLFDALDESKSIWQDNRRRLSESTPWMEAEIEEATDLMGEDWRPNGIEPNRQEIETLCEEALAQGLIDEPLGIDEVFKEYNELTS